MTTLSKSSMDSWGIACSTDEGMRHHVVAERAGPYEQEIDPFGEGGMGLLNLVGDKFIATYLYGPLGLIARTDERGDSDPGNNRDVYYAADASGGNVGLLVDHDGDPSTPREFRSQRFDAFGNRTTPLAGGAGPFAWRGQEGSVTDPDGGLVYMQSRYYDPTTGRFAQGDMLPLSRANTQGANRFSYAENDPANRSDPLGAASIGQVFLTIAATALIVGGIASAMLGALQGVGMALIGIAILLGLAASQTKDCTLRRALSGIAFAIGVIGLSIIFGVKVAQIAARLGAEYAILPPVSNVAANVIDISHFVSGTSFIGALLDMMGI